MEDIKKGWNDIKSGYNQEKIISFINEQARERIYQDSAQKTSREINRILENKGTTMLRGLLHNARKPKEPNTNILKMLLGESKRSFEDIEKIYKKDFRSKNHLGINIIVFMSLRTMDRTLENLSKIVGSRLYDFKPKPNSEILIELFKSLDYGFHTPENARKIIGNLENLSKTQKIEVFKSYDWIYKDNENAEKIFGSLENLSKFRYTFEQKLEIYDALDKCYHIPQRAEKIFGDLQKYDFEYRVKLFGSMDEIHQRSCIYDARRKQGLLYDLSEASDMQKFSIIKFLKPCNWLYHEFVEFFGLNWQQLNFQQRLTAFSLLTKYRRNMEQAKKVFLDLDKLNFEQKLAIFAKFDVQDKNLKVCKELFKGLEKYDINDTIKILELVDWYYELCSAEKERLVGKKAALDYIQETISKITDTSADLSDEVKLWACIACCGKNPNLVKDLWRYCEIEAVVNRNSFGRKQITDLCKKIMCANGYDIVNKFMELYFNSHEFLTDTEKIDIALSSCYDCLSRPEDMKIDFSEIGSHAIEKIAQEFYRLDGESEKKFYNYVKEQKESKKNKVQYQKKQSNNNNSININSEEEKNQQENNKHEKKNCVIF